MLGEFDRFIHECSQVFGEAEDWIDCDAVSTESTYTLPSMDRENSLDLLVTPTVDPTIEDVAVVDTDTVTSQDLEAMDPIQSRRLQEAENTLRSLQQQKVDQRIQEMEPHSDGGYKQQRRDLQLQPEDCRVQAAEGAGCDKALGRD